MDFNLLKKLCTSCGVSGDESGCKNLIKDIMKTLCDEIEDIKGSNLYCIKYAKKDNAPTVVIDAHMDSVGFMVKEINEKGTVKFDTIGGIDKRVLPSLEVILHGKEKIKGVISSIPPHLMEDGKEIKLDNMVIDTGYIKGGLENILSVGDRITYAPAIDIMGSCITGTYLDNRAGVAVIIETFEKLKGKELPFNLVAAFTVQEEIGLKGAKLFDKEAQLVIVVDVTHGQTPDEKGNEVYECGKGTAIAYGPNVHSSYFDMAVNCAEKNKLEYQVEVLEGNSGTNAWAYQVNGLSVPSLIFSFPLKFMHTPVETMRISDYDNLKELLFAFLAELNGDKINSISNVKEIV